MTADSVLRVGFLIALAVVVLGPPPRRFQVGARSQPAGRAQVQALTLTKALNSPSGSAPSLPTIPIPTPSPIPGPTPISDPTRTPPPSDVLSTFPTAAYLAELETAHQTVRILDTFPLPHEAFDDHHNRDRFLTGLQAAAERGGDVRILLLHAQSRTLTQRAAATTDQGINEQHYRDHVHRSMSALHALQTRLIAPEHRRSLRVRLITAFPGITCYQCDDRVLTASYPPNDPASQAPHMWVSANSDMARFLRSRFDNLWDHGEDLARHMFCEVRLPGLEAPLIDDMKFVETAGHVYLCFGDRTERDRAYAEEHVVVLLPDPLQRVPVQYGIAPVGRDVARSIEDAFTVKYPHDACPWGIGELLPVHRA